jgi:predicted histidine transporter YuiF (NhaC family)
MTKILDIELTEKGMVALAYALTGYLARGMEYSDLIEYYIDTQTAWYLNNPNKLKEDLENHGDCMIEFIQSMSKKLK